MSTASTRIIIALEGGLVQSVCTNDAALIGCEFVVVDYDTEGADPADLTMVNQGDGDIADAAVWGGNIGKCEISF